MGHNSLDQNKAEMYDESLFQRKLVTLRNTVGEEVILDGNARLDETSTKTCKKLNRNHNPKFYAARINIFFCFLFQLSRRGIYGTALVIGITFTIRTFPQSKTNHYIYDARQVGGSPYES